MKRLSKIISNYLALFIVSFVCLLSITFLLLGKPSEDGSLTLNGENAVIKPYTEKFIEDSNSALYRIMNESPATDEETKALHSEAGQGFYTTIEEIRSRRLPDGDNDSNKGWQCSKYTAYLATGKREYSTLHPDYGPVNGKDVASYLVNNFGFKYIDKPVSGAIGSGGFNTIYGHTAMYLFSTGGSTAMVNDANFTPLTVATHSMDITGWVWVVPSSYVEEPEEPEEEITIDDMESYVVKEGDTLGQIVLNLHWCDGCKLFGDDGYTEQLSNFNGITNRSLIYPNQVIKRL